MKILFTIMYIFMFMASLAKAKDCTYTYLAKPEESKYT